MSPDCRARSAQYLQSVLRCASVGGKFAHRATDLPAGSSSPMKWVQSAVPICCHAGVPLLVAAGMTVYSLHAGDPVAHCTGRISGPGCTLHHQGIVQERRARRNRRRSADPRLHIVDTLERGAYPLGVRLAAGVGATHLIDDASGDLLDAACAGCSRLGMAARDTQFGLPDFDPLEGWIVGA